jgi:MerR HTH family regulatory protein
MSILNVMPERQPFIPAGEFCEHYQVDLAFVQSLEEYGLIKVMVVAEKQLIPEESLSDLEKFIHLHYDLNINMEGIDAIQHLLQRVNSMREEMALLKNRLRIYE